MLLRAGFLHGKRMVRVLVLITVMGRCIYAGSEVFRGNRLLAERKAPNRTYPTELARIEKIQVDRTVINNFLDFQDIWALAGI